MIHTISICYITGNIFREIKYTSIDDLAKKLKLLFINNNTGLCMQLLINEHILNNFNITDMLVLSNLTKDDFITILFFKYTNITINSSM